MNYKSFAINLAKQAGATMRRNFAMGMKKQWKANETPVTVTDISINKMVIEQVKKNFPGHDVLGEEASYSKNRGEYVWVCDPVDGTIPFSHGVPTFVFSLALVKNGAPVLGVIYDPMLNRMLVAEKGKGCFFNGKKTRVNKRGLKHAAVCWCSSRLIWPLAEKYPNTFSLNFYSFVYGGMLVPLGELMAALYVGPHAHDAAAIKIVAEEAGGKVTDLNGHEQRYDRPVKGCLVSNGIVHDELIKITRQHPLAKGPMKKEWENLF